MIKFIRYVQTAVPLCQALSATRERLAQELGCRRSVYSFFKRLDQGNKGFLTAYDLQNGPGGVEEHGLQTEQLERVVARGLSYIDFYNMLFGALKEQLPQCCDYKKKYNEGRAGQLLCQLLVMESTYQESMQTSALAIREIEFETIYSTFNRIDSKQLQMINGEALAQFMQHSTGQQYTERQVEPFMIRELGSVVVSFPEFFDLFEKVKRNYREAPKRVFDKLELREREYSPEDQKTSKKKMVRFTNDVIRTASRRIPHKHSSPKRDKSQLAQHPQRKLATLSVFESQHRQNKFLKYFRRGVAAKEARRSCERFLRTSPGKRNN